MLAKLILTLISITSIGLAHAGAPQEQPHWSVACQTSKGAFTLKFDSPTNDLTNDDMKVTLESERGAVAVGLKPAWYHKRDSVSQLTHKSACNGIGAFDMGDGTLLFFVTRDNRPGFDLLSLFLYDPAENRVLDQLEGVDLLKSSDSYTSYIVLKTPDGFKTRLVRDWIPNTGRDSAETAIEDWKQIRVLKHKLSASW